MKKLSTPKITILVITALLPISLVLGFYNKGPFSWISASCPDGTTKILDNEEYSGAYDYGCY